LMLADVGTQSVLQLDISLLRYGLFCIQALSCICLFLTVTNKL
jgi:hypothetical protein